MRTRFHNPYNPETEATRMSRAELQKAYDELVEEHEQVKTDYNDLRENILAGYELISENPLETASDEDDDDDEGE